MSEGGWEKHHAELAKKKLGSRPYATFLPSKEMLLSLPLLIITRDATRPHGWGSIHLAGERARKHSFRLSVCAPSARWTV